MAEIEYFYSAHSGYAYLGSALFMRIAEAAGRRIVHKPVDLNRVVMACGSPDFAQRPPAYAAYHFGRDMERWAEHREAPMVEGRPKNHREPMTLPNGMLVAGVQQGLNVDRLAHRMLEAHWRDNADLTDRETLAGIAREVGLDPEPLLEAALGEEAQAALEANTQEAIARSGFGSPTNFVDGDMFYGQDHLEMVERALKQPYAGTWPKA